VNAPRTVEERALGQPIVDAAQFTATKAPAPSRAARAPEVGERLLPQRSDPGEEHADGVWATWSPPKSFRSGG